MSASDTRQTQPRWRRALLAVMGVGLVVLALIMPSLGLPGLEGFSVAQLLLLALAGLLFVISIANEQIVARRLASGYRFAAITLLTTLLVLVIAEMVSIIIWSTKVLAIPLERIIPTASKLAYYQTVSWGEGYWQEYEQVQKQRYKPYVVWRQTPFAGEFINIDEQGIRHTPGADCQPESYTVFVLGGSTVWGTGAPDSMTIPAYLQAGLDSIRSEPICVVNFGELGYVSTQEVIRLLLELRDGNVPDMVLFYDGLNDIFAAYQNGGAGEHQNLDYIAGRYELRPQVHPLLQWWWQSYTYKVINLYQAPAATIAEDNSGVQNTGNDALADDILNVYAGNLRLVSTLAQYYGFDYAFLWQPDLSASRKARDPEEQKMVDALDKTLDSLYLRVYEKAARIRWDNFYNIADVFDEYDGAIWVDSAHIIPEGNAIIAQKMIDVITSVD